MGFIIGLLNFVGFLFYIVAAIAVFCILIGFMCNNDKDGAGIKVGLIAAVVATVFGYGGYFIREYSDTLKKSKNFTECLTNGEKEKVKWRFGGLSTDDKKAHIEEIFAKFYGNNFEDERDFLNDYGKEELEFVNILKEQFNIKLKNMYDEAEKQNTRDSWLSFSNKVSGKIFLEYADESIKEREFAKWNDDEGAWQRVLVMDSLAMSYEYLSRFNHGSHEDNARKIILDHSYVSYSSNKPPYKITRNFSGSTTISVRNSANAKLNIHYSGTFASGNFEVQGYGYNSVSVPNGYYSISVSSLSARGETTLETLDGGVKSFDYHIIADTGRRR